MMDDKKEKRNNLPPFQKWNPEPWAYYCLPVNNSKKPSTSRNNMWHSRRQIIVSFLLLLALGVVFLYQNLVHVQLTTLQKAIITATTNNVNNYIKENTYLASIFSIAVVPNNSRKSLEEEVVVDHEDDDIITIYILGAGISGIAAAKTLLEEEKSSTTTFKNKNLRVVILEANPNRIGGRIKSEIRRTSASLFQSNNKNNTNNNAAATSNSSYYFGIDLGGASIHGRLDTAEGEGGEERSPLGLYLQKQNFNNNTMVDWGSSIYPAIDNAIWWNFNNEPKNNDDDDDSKSSLSSSRSTYQILNATQIRLLNPYVLSWRQRMSDCLIEHSSSDTGKQQQQKQQKQNSNDDDDDDTMIDIETTGEGNIEILSRIKSTISSSTTSTTSRPNNNNVSSEEEHNNNNQKNIIMRQCLAISLEATKKEILDISSSTVATDNNNDNDYDDDFDSTTTGSITWDMFIFHLYMENEMDRGISLTDLSIDGYDNDWDFVEVPGKDLAMPNQYGMKHLMDTLLEGLMLEVEVHNNNSDNRNDVDDDNGGNNDDDDDINSSIIKLGQRVVRIEYYTSSNDDESDSSSSTKSYCRITTEEGKIYRDGRACIVTLPLGVLKHNHASLFNPPLPSFKQEALGRAGISAYNTLVIEWKIPICQNTTPAIYMINSPLSSTSSINNPLSYGFLCPEIIRSNYTTTTSHVTQFYISGTTNTKTGMAYNFSDMTYWKQQSLEVVSLYYNNTRRKNSQQQKEDEDEEPFLFNPDHHNLSMNDILSIELTKWHEDRDFLGSYSAPIEGTNGNIDRQILQDSVSKSLYFAGEHTNTRGRYQTIDGAYDSGVLAARALLKDLG